jgi:hypothetical protein
MAFRCSIGIVTYLGRFDSFFKPLIRKTNFLFPDYDVIIFVNGHYDTGKQIQYLGEITCFLRNYPSIRYVTNQTHQALARGWNWLALMSLNENTLILNDDVSFNLEFRHNLESLRSVPEVFTINGSWSHFVVSKSIIRRVGWFDERFAGVGDEDYDYMCRLAMNGIPVRDIGIHGIHNFVATQDQAGWSSFSDIVDGKYAQVNRDLFKRKWYFSKFEEVPDQGSFRMIRGADEYIVALREDSNDMPQYYPLICLDTSETQPRKSKEFATILAKVCSLLNSVYWRVRLRVGRCGRKVLGNKWYLIRGKKGQ